MAASVDFLKNQAERLRIHSLESTTKAGSGHPTTCMSAAEIMSVLFFDVMRYDPSNLESFDNDEFVLSKGHAAPVLYAALAEAGAIPVADLATLRAFDSALEGHPIPGRAPGVRVATGSLGQGLSAAIGMALAMKQDGSDRRVYVLLGDGEMAEGSVWEAMNLAPHLGLDNLVAVVDVNRLGQSDPTMYEWDADAYARRAAAFDWQAEVVDGHDVAALQAALQGAVKAGKPCFISAKTKKGKGVSFLENADGMHGKAVGADQLDEARREIEARIVDTDERIANQIKASPNQTPAGPRPIETSYELGAGVATRKAYGTALVKLGEQDDSMVVLDGDVKNSTFTEPFFERFPDRSVECFIAEQNMIGISLGLQARGRRAFAATFAAFLSRAYDNIRMASHSRADLKLAGSHTGVSIGEDGPSQMGLEDVAMMRAVAGSVVVCPADAVAAEKLTAECAAFHGVSYLRTARPDRPVIYANDEEFPVGGAKVLRSSDNDVATIVASGVTVAEALDAADRLATDGTSVRVIDCYSLKPIDGEALRDAAQVTGRVITVEDHYPEGGLGEAVAAAIAGVAPLTILAVSKATHSGKGGELMAEQGIDADGIVRAVTG